MKGHRSMPPFPTKFATLPRIESPVPTASNQLLPYTGGGGGGTMDDRVQQLENRISVTEKSNRALLEEVVRLQSEVKVTQRRTDDTTRGDRSSRDSLENALRASAELVAAFGARLKHAEDSIRESRVAMGTLMSHSKSVEQALLGTQQELLSRRETQANRTQDLRNDLDETLRAKDQLERVTFQLVDDLRQLKAKVDTQMMDFSTATSDLKNKSMRLEEENRQTVESMRKQGDYQTQTEQTTSQLRNQVENRLSELRDVLMELRGKQEQEAQDRRLLEQQMQIKMSELSGSVSEVKRQHAESILSLESAQRDRDHHSETERLRLQAAATEAEEQTSSRLLQREMKMREENQARFAQLDEGLMNEREARQKFEKTSREASDNRWDSLRKLNKEEMHILRDQQKMERKKANNIISKLSESVDLIEKQLEEQKKQQEKLMGAEIKSRKQCEKSTLDKVTQLHEKLGVATATLQQAMGGMHSKMETNTDKLRTEIFTLLEERHASGTRGLTDLDLRLNSVHQRLAQAEEALEAKIASASATQAQNLRDKVDSLSQWQRSEQENIRDLQSQIRELPQQLQSLGEKQINLDTRLTSELLTETNTRIREVEELRKELEKKGENGNGDEQPDAGQLDAVQASIRKLAESIQTVKTVLAMKIQSEQKLRTEEIEELRERLSHLPLVPTEAEPQARVFVNGAETVGGLNKWSVYTAYRWSVWKSKWMYIKWKRDATRQSQPPFTGPDAVPSNGPGNNPDTNPSNDPNNDLHKQNDASNGEQ